MIIMSIKTKAKNTVKASKAKPSKILSRTLATTKIKLKTKKTVAKKQPIKSQPKKTKKIKPPAKKVVKRLAKIKQALSSIKKITIATGKIAAKKPAAKTKANPSKTKSPIKKLFLKNSETKTKIKNKPVKKNSVLSLASKMQPKKKTQQAPLKRSTKLQKTIAKKPQQHKNYNITTGEEYMNATQVRHFENLLLQWKEELLREAEVTVQDMQSTSANFPDPVDRASQEEEFNLELRTRDRERKLLKKIAEALHRIKESNYGYCDECGSEIGVRRLEARPTATQCIECKTISEIREKQVGEIGKEKEEDL